MEDLAVLAPLPPTPALDLKVVGHSVDLHMEEEEDETGTHTRAVVDLACYPMREMSFDPEVDLEDPRARETTAWTPGITIVGMRDERTIGTTEEKTSGNLSGGGTTANSSDEMFLLGLKFDIRLMADRGNPAKEYRLLKDPAMSVHTGVPLLIQNETTSHLVDSQ
jgi:hypothetical protein